MQGRAVNIHFLRSFQGFRALILSFILTVVCPFLATASEAVDYRQKLGPAREQGANGICYAHAIADALSLKTGQNIGAVSVAMRYYQKRSGLEQFILEPFTNGSPDTFQAGLTPTALKIATENTICPRHVEIDILTDPYTRKGFRMARERYRRFRSTYSPTPPSDIILDVKYIAEYFFPGLNSETLVKNLDRGTPFLKAVGGWLDQECDIQISNKGEAEIISSDFIFDSKDEIIQNINAALDRHSLPIIHYDPRFMKNSGKTWRNVLSALHVSSIAGRRQMPDGSYQFLLRNTWGADCSSKTYKPEFLERCEEGHVWLYENELRPEIQSSTYLK